MGCSSSKKPARTVPQESIDSLACAHGNNEDIRDKYELGAILGSGSFGQVREAVLKDVFGSEKRAVKVIERDSAEDAGEWSNQEMFVREVSLLQNIQHEHIIRYYDFYVDPHFLYVVMELCKGGEVFGKIIELKRFSEKDAAALGKQMLQATMYIHQMQIIHRDIKAENFMLAEPTITSQVKMIDFGMACKLAPGAVLKDLCGSPHYLAPELIGQNYDFRADVWAFGVLMYLLMYGHYPYDAKHPHEIMVKILTDTIRWQTKAKVSKNGLSFLKSCLDHDPKTRITAAQGLEHPWMQISKSKDRNSEGEALPAEVLRSAHRKVTDSKKLLLDDPKITELRINQKLQQIDEDFTKGIRHGQRLGETPKEEFMSKPEYVRRENKITTAPSGARRGSVKKLLESLGGIASPLKISESIDEDRGTECSNKQNAKSNFMDDVSISAIPTAMPPKLNRNRSLSAIQQTMPRRLSYIGATTPNQEQEFAEIWLEKIKQGNLPAPVQEEQEEAGESEEAGALPEKASPLPDTVQDEKDEKADVDGDKEEKEKDC